MRRDEQPRPRDQTRGDGAAQVHQAPLEVVAADDAHRGEAGLEHALQVVLRHQRLHRRGRLHQLPRARAGIGRVAHRGMLVQVDEAPCPRPGSLRHGFFVSFPESWSTPPDGGG